MNAPHANASADARFIAADTAVARGNVRVSNKHVVAAGSLVLLLPNVLFALRLEPLPAAVLLAGGLGFALSMPWRRSLASDAILAQPLDLVRFGISLVIAIALLVLGGEGHLFFANWDWLWRDAVLSDLVRAPFPPLYEAGGQAFFLRAPLGMYMLPALFARATSLGVGHGVMLAQNAVLLAAVIYLIAALAQRRAALVLIVFLSFSGLDAVGELIMWLKQGGSLAGFALPTHVESWIGLQYSSVVTQLFWVPNHALPSYWLALLVMFGARQELEVGDIGLGLAVSLFWSPFAFIGTLPFAVYLFVKTRRDTIGSIRFWLAGLTALCFLPVAFYLRADAAQVPHELFLLQPYALATILLFLFVEIPHLAVIREVWGQFDAALRGIFLTAIIVLVALPTMRVGMANDLVMRASIPALTILAFAFAQALAIAWRDRRPYLLAAGPMLALVGAVTPAQEIIRSLIVPRYAISDCNLVTVWKKLWAEHPMLENYLARQTESPVWLFGKAQGDPLTNQSKSTCWPDFPLPPRFDVMSKSNQMLLRARDGAKPPAL